MSERSVRVERDGVPTWAHVDGETLIFDDGQKLAEADATYFAPVDPSKIIAVHLTYQSRLTEYVAKTPAYPSYFMKPPTTLNGNRGLLRRPHGTRFLNYEGELAVIIGRRMKGVGIDDALGYVAGYAPANDVGLHDFRHADRGAMLRVKGQDGFLPIGPWVTPAAEFDPTTFTLTTTLNGDLGRRLPAGRSQPADHA
jgi:5-oxopent-3-ene-1,2,5-tricarboxylate decarboxylase/2-hydroxyhepta-2,4-diene-1,7-dioate isomerase